MGLAGNDLANGCEIVIICASLIVRVKTGAIYNKRT